MSYLLDTNVVSEVRRRAPDPGVASWWKEVPADRLYLSVLTVGEIQRGAQRCRKRGDDPQATRLEEWLAAMTRQFAARILPVTAEVTVEWGRQDNGRPVPVTDALIAATARVHDLTLVTRNVRDMERTGARVHNPFSG
ncbi:type II toxin-antitoxin system VapC family toxin [Amycolatopsis cihanbeyliensis]|uniref:Ribonuclease VapC n=1 Tax=Amycolatopsis cihanbeyliensis TaxID=1128664 RepID=A0A542DM10_AMYCI|nr:type II toxin-antitoxin system VapC family toxin [Amycolatopsis cihanbeyliensis]TQJ04108.1 hypothetical protein FB471_3889 [Amycolatopsis cihanbeyliensis]